MKLSVLALLFPALAVLAIPRSVTSAASSSFSQIDYHVAQGKSDEVADAAILNTNLGDSVVRRVENHASSRTNPRSICFYPLVMACITCLVIATNYDKGRAIILKILMYLCSLSTMKLTVKYLFDEFDFTYPSFVASLHLLFSALVGFAVLFQRSRCANEMSYVMIPTVWEFVGGIVPIGIAFGATLGFNNASLTLCSASYTEIIGSTTPLVTVAMMIVMGLPFDLKLLGPVILVAAGCTMSISGEVHFSWLGTVFAFMANVTRSARSTLQQKLMTGPTKSKFDPPALLAWTCGASFLIMSCVSFFLEGYKPWHHVQGEQRKLHFLVALLVGCVNATVLNLAVLFVTKDLGAVGQQIVAQTKSIATVFGGVFVLGESFTHREVLGFAMVLLGTALYSYMQGKSSPAGRNETGKQDSETGFAVKDLKGRNAKANVDYASCSK